MKWRKWLVVILAAAIWMMPMSAQAITMSELKSGIVLGKADKSVTKFFVNDVQVPTMTFNGRLIVFTKDLKSFGFATSWNQKQRDIVVRRDLARNEFAKVKDTTSAKPVNVLHTDIRVYLDNRLVPVFYVDNATAIYAEDLFRYGSISYDTKAKEQRLTLSKYPSKDLPLGMRISEADNSIHISNYSDIRYYYIDYDLFYYNRVTQKIEVLSDRNYGLDARKKDSGGYWGPGSSLGYSNAWKYIFLGFVIKSTTDDNWNVVKNPIYKDEANYVKTKYLDYALMIEKVRKTELTNELKVNNNVPLKVTGTTIGYNLIGIPEPEITFKNLSDKTIDALEIEIRCYDTFGRAVTFPGYSNLFRGIAQEVMIPSGTEDTFVWTLNLFDNTTKVNVTVTNVHYTDGTTWKKKK
ncbi:hypothetical protein [Paenibacillus sp. NPDC057967]|uniref:hypothetical protein n=1 Tax=Paenibacillus sp. NPDC057967 TaxID=3346293 RepID=UPI0036D80722